MYEKIDLNQITIMQYLDKLGYTPHKILRDKAFYISPIRNENNPSFVVNLRGNVWYDFGIGRGGNIVTLTKDMFHIHHYRDVLKKIHEVMGPSFNIARSDIIKPKPAPLLNSVIAKGDGEYVEPQREMPLECQRISDYMLKYGTERKIPENILRKYCHQYIKEFSGKKYSYIGMKNISNGVELRNRYSKISLGKKDITVIPSRLSLGDGFDEVRDKRSQVFVSEGMFDFLSLVTLKPETEGYCHIILNGVTQTPKAIDYIKEKQFQKIHTYLDNDSAGRVATEKLFKAFPGKCLTYMPHYYTEYNDLNDVLLDRKMTPEKMQAEKEKYEEYKKEQIERRMAQKRSENMEKMDMLRGLEQKIKERDRLRSEQKKNNSEQQKVEEPREDEEYSQILEPTEIDRHYGTKEEWKQYLHGIR